MTPSDAVLLRNALCAVDWNSLVLHFLGYPDLPVGVTQSAARIALWSRQLENAESGNPAISFVREMQSAGHDAVTLASLALYKPSAASTRTVVEDALYYTYFRTHPSELTTLVRDPNYFISKTEIIEYHRTHTPNFAKYQACFDLVAQLNKWYSHISSIVHGQIPGVWTTHKSISETKHVMTNLEAAVAQFQQAEGIVHHLFLCTVGVELWDTFSPEAKSKLIAGIPGKTKATLGLEAA